MNTDKRLIARVALVLCTILVGALAGCVVYEEPPPQQAVYAPPPPPPPPPPVESSVVVIQNEADFYEPLNPYGRWVVVGPYGRCWSPGGVNSSWRPYCNGHWERTDAGWYWVSGEPWGWATYHYGRWAWDPGYGWVWIPQTQWAPAWVVWREGGGYCGWAPLGPSARFGATGMISVGVVEPRGYVFVEERRMLEPVRPTTVIVNNTTIINKTVNITKITVVNKTVINEGPRKDVLERATGRTVQTTSFNQLRHTQESAAVASQPRLKAVQVKIRNPAPNEVKPQPQQHGLTQEERARKAQDIQTRKEQGEEKAAEEKEQRTQSVEKRLQEKQQKIEVQQERKAESEQQQKERKSADKAAKDKKKAEQEEERRAKGQQPPQ